MCTVTFLPLKNENFALVSSRDIPFARAKAALPKIYLEDGVKLCYPMDGKAGGSWIGISDKKRLICLLNGGYEYHTSLSKYKKSRGQIVKELLKEKDLEIGLKRADLKEVEQFTLVIAQWDSDLKLYEFVWDGTDKHLNKLDLVPRIWSSATLYDPQIKEQRESWFDHWLGLKDVNPENLLNFHKTAGIGDPHIDLMMNRGVGGTVSISAVEKKGNEVTFQYEDVTNGEHTRLIFV